MAAKSGAAEAPWGRMRLAPSRSSFRWAGSAQ